MDDSAIIDGLRQELDRLKATQTQVRIDSEFEPEAGRLVYLQMGSAYWHFLPGLLMPLLRQLPDGAGNDAIKQTIERHATLVWHGPSPKDSRDRS